MSAMRGRKPNMRLGDRCEVKGFVPPARMVEIATERTQGLAEFYIISELRHGHDSTLLPMLLRSAYMQGVNDTIDSITQTGTFTPTGVL